MQNAIQAAGIPKPEPSLSQPSGEGEGGSTHAAGPSGRGATASGPNPTRPATQKAAPAMMPTPKPTAPASRATLSSGGRLNGNPNGTNSRARTSGPRNPRTGGAPMAKYSSSLVQ